MDAQEFFRWCDSLDLAESQEVVRRNYASRYYYGLYHLISNSFPEMPSYKGVGTHKGVSEFLERGYTGKDYDQKELKKLSYLMKQSKNFRVNADYMMGSEFTLNDCNAAKASVFKCIDKLKEIKGSTVFDTQRLC